MSDFKWFTLMCYVLKGSSWEFFVPFKVACYDEFDTGRGISCDDQGGPFSYGHG